MILLRDISKLLTLQGAAQKHARSIQDQDLSISDKQAILVDKNRIVWLGDLKKLPKDFKKKI